MQPLWEAAMADILGIDISMHNSDGHPIDWDGVPADKVRFVFVKATEGGSYEDPWFDRHWSAAKSKNFVCGAYHFYRSNRSGADQAENVKRNILGQGQLGKGDLPVAIDVEELKAVEGTPGAIAKFLQELETCCRSVEAAMGAPPLIYTAGYVWKALGNPPNFARYPLWIAYPDKPAPRLPAPWTDYAIWQYSFKGKIAGLKGPVDLDSFNGSQADFNKLLLK
jgi:lysozyme